MAETVDVRNHGAGPGAEGEPVAAPGAAHAGRLAAIGVGLAVLAGGLAIIPAVIPLLSTVRLWLVGLGAVITGYALSLQAAQPRYWLYAAAFGLIAGLIALPPHWDSIRFMFRVLAGVALLGAVFVALNFTWRVRLASALIAFHFCGIFLATTSPATQAGTPPYWITEQLFNKIFMHYLQFVYLRNAYHFYSPEPGPASIVAFLIKTKAGKEIINGEERDRYERRWVVIPRRPQDVKDPLGVSYFRRLSITEQVAAPGSPVVTSESSEIYQRRMMAFYEEPRGPGRVVEQLIPLNPYEPMESQYRMPSLITYRYLLPSYAQHIIHEEVDRDKMEDTTVMIYQLVHRTMNVQEARAGVAPFAPGAYRAFYLGEYNVHGELVNPRDPMLYWHVPVYARQPGYFTDENPEKFEDYLSRHAGLTFNWSWLR